jgi:polyferredoxin
MKNNESHKKHHAKKHHPRKTPRTSRKKSPLHYVKVFFLYLIALGALAAWIDVTSYGAFDVVRTTLATIALSFIATIVHWFSGRRDRFDDIADGDL